MWRNSSWNRSVSFAALQTSITARRSVGVSASVGRTVTVRAASGIGTPRVWPQVAPVSEDSPDDLSISVAAVRLVGDNPPRRSTPMKYMLMIHQGTTPTPLDPDAWATLSEEQQQAIYQAYNTLNSTPGVTPGLGLQPPETATTVRVDGGRTVTTDGPFVDT